MRCAIVSDIHANLDALAAVLEAMGEVDALYCPGDIVGYGAEPNECCGIIRERATLSVIGNHDAAAVGLMDSSWFNPHARAAVKWTAGILTPENRRYLRELPPTASTDMFLVFHGELEDPMSFEYITDSSDARLLAFPHMGGHSLAFFGHTHIAEYYFSKEGTSGAYQVSMFAGGVIELKAGFRYIVNCGSVGQPRDGNPKASFGIYDSEAGTVEILRVPYDIAAAKRKIRGAGLPDILAERLEYGF